MTRRVSPRQQSLLRSAMTIHIEAVIVTHVTVRHAAVFSLIGIPPAASTCNRRSELAKTKTTPILGKRGRREPRVLEHGE